MYSFYLNEYRLFCQKNNLIEGAKAKKLSDTWIKLKNTNNVYNIRKILFTQVVWAPVTRSSFQKRTWRISGSISKKKNNASPMYMPLCTS
jgi:hypothetical protein